MQLGHVKKLGRITGRKSQSYQLQIPVLATEEMNTPTNRRVSEKKYKAKKKAKEAEKKSKADAKAQEFIEAMSSNTKRKKH